ncbi:hypothetical protein GCM10010924_07710 [Rhizobium wenxiniae]|nr:hypothetical protein GCM10010924_07710 [Rhizobium wenxiniae]
MPRGANETAIFSVAKRVSTSTRVALLPADRDYNFVPKSFRLSQLFRFLHGAMWVTIIPATRWQGYKGI